MYSQEDMDHVHDTLIDLIISCMFSGNIPREEPKVGEWCIECTRLNVNRDRDDCIGILKSINGDGDYTIETVGGKEVHWSNAELKKIPSKFMRKL